MDSESSANTVKLEIESEILLPNNDYPTCVTLIYPKEEFTEAELNITVKQEEESLSQAVDFDCDIKLECDLPIKQELLHNELVTNCVDNSKEQPTEKPSEKSTSNTVKIYNHYKTHCGNKCYKCSVCEYKSISWEDLEQHVIIHRRDEFLIASNALKEAEGLLSEAANFKCTTENDYNLSINQEFLQEELVTNFEIVDISKEQLTEKPPETSSSNANIESHNKTRCEKKCYKCCICGYKSISREDLEQHVIVHRQEISLICSECGYRCMKKSHLQQHMKTHTVKEAEGLHSEAANFKCTTENDYNLSINQEFQQEELVTNFEIVNNSKEQPTEKPPETSSSNTNIDSHDKTRCEKKCYQCCICGYTSISREDLEEHVIVHRREKSLICSECDYRCTKESHLQQHMKTHTVKEAANFKCTTENDYNLSINQEFQQEELVTNFEIVDNSKEQPTEKPPEISSSNTNIESHDKSREKKCYKCCTCGYKSISMKDLEQHVIVHRRKKSLICSKCGYRCMKKSHLQQHMKTHTGEKPFKCSVCDYRCGRKYILQRHTSIHTEDKPFKCSLCDYSCKVRANLGQHMKVHADNNKPFKCHICEYSAIRRAYLQEHMKRHTGETPFKCSACDYTCSWSGNLKQHEKVHTREKPFECYKCGYKCNQKHGLVRHMKNRH